ncbi:MAG: tetratricopeptide repeat protein [Bacteroidota bacterium]|nr:tetratricopeptide repeat protein [Bacteroidota bacterium]
MAALLLHAQDIPSYSYPTLRPFSDEGALYEIPQTSTSELGLRYLKLGNSYREVGNMDMAQYFVRRGLDLIRGRGSRYWEAVGNEYLGLIYRDIGDRIMALEYLYRAERLYKSVLGRPSVPNSIDAVQQIVRDTEYGYRSSTTRSPLVSATSGYSMVLSERERLERTQTALQRKIVELEDRIRQLEANQNVSSGR